MRWKSRGHKSRIACTLAILFTLCLAPEKSFAITEEELQIALLLKVAQFSKWPPRGEEQFNFCLYRGKGYELYTSDKDRKLQIDSLPVQFIFLKNYVSSELIQQCHLLFITVNSSVETKQLLRRAAFAPTLTASTLKGFADFGGMIELHKRNNRYKFRVNLTPLKESKLNISSSLLEISDIVRGKAK